MSHTTIILQGGAMRGAFGAGVLYEFASRGFFVDTIAAASASVSTAAYYAARQHEEMRKIWLEEVGNKRLIRLGNLLSGKPIYDIEYLIEEVFKKKYPLDVQRLAESPTRFILPLYNYQERRLELRSNTDAGFAEDAWSLLHMAMIIHDSHILWGTRFEPYVDGALDPFALYKLDYIPENSRIIVIWNEPKFDMHLIKRLGQRIFIALQTRTFPAEVQRMLQARHQLIIDGMKIYAAFCEKRRPAVIKPDPLSLLDGLDVLSRNNTHLAKLFGHGRAKARQILFSETT